MSVYIKNNCTLISAAILHHKLIKSKDEEEGEEKEEK
jgi:hypothetical protein